MSKEHLTYFKVENFKRFDSLELTDIGQFNLIVGDNNVGKTSLLEALLFDTESKKCISNFHETLFKKGLNIKPRVFYGHRGEISEIQYPDENFLRYIFKDIEKSLSVNFKIKDESHHGGGIIISMSKSPDEMPNLNEHDLENIHFTGKTSDNRYVWFDLLYHYDIPYSDEGWGGDGQEFSNNIISGLYEHITNPNKNENFPLISTSLPGKDMLSKSYFEQVGLSQKEKKYLIETMKFLLSEIEYFEAGKIGGEDQLLVAMKGQDKLMPISTFGESVTRATQIMLEISKYKGKRLMIDEIDTGIHYSRMKNFLKTVFQVAQKNEVQLFMTTHSLECQQAFAEVFEGEDMKAYQDKVRQFTLIEKLDGHVKAINRNFKQLEFALQTDNETRGGKRAW